MKLHSGKQFIHGNAKSIYDTKNGFKASKRLSDRLGKKGKEDDDVETIISCLIAIGKLQSMKMFDYGVQFAEKKVKEESLTNN